MNEKSRSKLIIFMFFLSVSIFPTFTFNSMALDPPPSGIILFIGDGMGYEHVELARLVEYGPEGQSAIFEFPYQTSVSTVNIDSTTTDSAAAATAISTGVKTRNGRIAMNYNAKIDLTTILEIAQNNGYRTGVIATSHLTHATPASFMAHDSSRNHYVSIAEDISNAEVDVLLGGGSDIDYLGQFISNMESSGYEYISNQTELNSANSTSLLGLFTDTSLTPMHIKNETSIEPDLLEMTQKAIQLLNDTGDPYFLMIEGSQIDWGSHDNDPIYAGLETIEFEKSVKYAQELGENDSNLQILVTSDHETGGLKVESYNLISPLPLETDSYETKKNKRINRVNEISTSWSTGGHTNKKVILAGMGPNSEKIFNATHHIDTFSIMRELIDGETDPKQINASNGHVSWILLTYISLLGISIVLTTLFSIRRNLKIQKK